VTDVAFDQFGQSSIFWEYPVMMHCRAIHRERILSQQESNRPSFLILWVLMFWFLGATAISTGTIIAVEAILNF
jgi:hypothetical protein